MKGGSKKYNFYQRLSAAFMIVALLWLTISAPFVVAAQQKIAKQDRVENAISAFGGNEEEAANPFGNTTEEKAPSNSTFSEEYLHDHHKTEYILSIVSQYHKCEDAGTYVAFHGELLVPPPNAS